MLSAIDRKILEKLACEIRRKHPAARVWAYGSRTRGDAAPDSDLDVCIVLDSLDEAIDRDIMRIAWSVGMEHDVVISTLTYSSEEFEQGPCSVSPIVRTIRQDGIAA